MYLCKHNHVIVTGVVWHIELVFVVPAVLHFDRPFAILTSCGAGDTNNKKRLSALSFLIEYKNKSKIKTTIRNRRKMNGWLERSADVRERSASERL